MSPPITRWLNSWRQTGKPPLDEAAAAYIYQELRQKAAGLLQRERQGHTLETSALVHETYLRLVEQRQVQWQNRVHFLALAARMMRRILSNYARDRASSKRAGRAQTIPLDESFHIGPGQLEVITSLEDGLRALAQAHPEHAELVELRFFGGLTREEISEVLQISVPTVTRRWTLARAWLYRYLENRPAKAGRDSTAEGS